MKLHNSPEAASTVGRLNPAPVVIAIVGYRNAEDICACVGALAESTDQNFTISICENGGRAAFAELTTQIQSQVRSSGEDPEILDSRVAEAWAGSLCPGGQRVFAYRAKANLGFAGGVNVSIKQSGVPQDWSAIWLLNPDTQPAPGALKALVDRAIQGGYAVVGSRVISKSTQRVQLYGGRWRPLIARGFNIGLNAMQDAAVDATVVERSMTYVSGASLYATRNFVETVGVMREDYFLYAEDVDWCLRRGGHRLGYAHGSVIYHKHGATIGSSPRRKNRSKLSVYLDERNKLLLTRRFHPNRFPLVTFFTLLLLGQYIIEGAPRNFLTALSGWFAGVRGETGAPPFITDARVAEQ